MPTPNRQRQAEIAARLTALKALQEKVQTEGKLKPWLARHGLDRGLPAVDPGAHRAGLGDGLESALRERLSALGSRWNGARLRRPAPPPAGVLRRPAAAIANNPTPPPRLSDLLRLGERRA